MLFLLNAEVMQANRQTERGSEYRGPSNCCCKEMPRLGRQRDREIEKVNTEGCHKMELEFCLTFYVKRIYLLAVELILFSFVLAFVQEVPIV